MAEQEKEFGLAEAAHRLHLPYQTCHRLVLTGVLQAQKRAARWIVTRAEVDRLAETLPNIIERRSAEAHVRGGHLGGHTNRDLENEIAEMREELAGIKAAQVDSIRTSSGAATMERRINDG